MEQIVIDTSVVVKWFLNETDSDKALDLLEKIKNRSLLAIFPSIIFLELENAIYFSGSPTIEKLQTAIFDLFNLKQGIITPDIFLLNKMASLMVQFDLAAYDALFLALAENRQIPLITADKKHHQQKFSKFIKYL
ncbi:type II toxin-antitoxin system VapC family toxin [Candidatus Gottesmanbacteria bacterium]|nr:type II toxin-antitoxin system VapC family toxin [Candidatus Gottesmanbacteria bacterium]